MSVLVIGDLLLDKYLKGEVSRLSAEAPVPVLEAVAEFSVPGGAANVACNAAAHKIDVTLIGRVGDDADGKKLQQLCEGYNVKTEFLFDQTAPTHTKLRLVTGAHQLLRVDREKQSTQSNLELLQKVKNVFSGQKIAIISDYSKGLFDNETMPELIKYLRQKNVFVIIDPKEENKLLYFNASVLTPNLREFEVWVGKTRGHDDLVLKARKIIAELNLEYLLITLGAEGMVLVSGNEVTRVFPEARRVYDVTGAGDTVVAVLGVGLSSGFKIEDAVKKANTAAAIAVEKFGTTVVFPADYNKIQVADNIGKALELLYSWRQSGEKITMTNGCFDLLHSGHLDLLEQAASFGTKLVVILNKDVSVQRLKGAKRPIKTFNERARLLSSLGFVDLVIGFDENTPLNIFKKFAPDILVKGGDYTAVTVVGATETVQHGGVVKIIPLVEGQSTTSIIAQILESQNDS